MWQTRLEGIALGIGSALLVLAAISFLTGCATAPVAEWQQMPDGAWVGPATTYQKGSEPGRYMGLTDEQSRAIDQAILNLNARPLK